MGGLWVKAVNTQVNNLDYFYSLCESKDLFYFMFPQINSLGFSISQLKLYEIESKPE